MNFFPEKHLINFSWTFWPLLFCKILKKFLGLIQHYEDVPFWGQKWLICHEQIFLVQTLIIAFIHLLAYFIMPNQKKTNLQQTHSYEDAAFLGPKWSNCPKQIFFWKNVKIILIYLLAPFIVQNVKKVLPADPELWGCALFGPKMAYFPKWQFSFRKPVNVSFIHAYLHAKNQSQILIH